MPTLKIFTLILLQSLLFFQHAIAVTIVRLDFEYGSDSEVASGEFDIAKINKVLDIELFDDETPITVSNFLNYVNNGRYDQIFINRSIPGFILQMGGFNNISTDPINEPLGASLGVVDAFPDILNEPGISNIRGTIAMAKLAGQPNSATSEWFINLADNSANLDFQNEGFTVFGKVIDDGMDISDQIETFPVVNAGAIFGAPFSMFPFTDLPLADYDVSSPGVPFQSNLVMIQSATVIERPILSFVPDNADFGFDLAGDEIGKSMELSLTNTGNESLQINTITNTALSGPFSIQSDGCSGVTIDPVSVSTCTLSLQFMSAIPGIFTDSLVIIYSSKVTNENFSVTYELSGAGSEVGSPEISTVTTFDIGASQVAGVNISRELQVNNTGEDSLQIINITGLADTGFSQDNDCINGDDLIAPGDFCTILIDFEATDFNLQTATLSIESSDPVNSTVNIELSATGSSDADGVSTAIENAASDTGDANFDGVQDSLQNTVASFAAEVDSSQEPVYLTLVVDNQDVVTRISVQPEDEDSQLPEGIVFKYGILEYDVIVNSPNDIVQVGLVLPAGEPPSAFYMFGETDDNETEHWHQYPATQILPNVTISDSVRNILQITVQDGGPGDADGRVNGRIHIGPSIVAFSTGSDSGGAASLIFLVFYALLFILISSCGRAISK